MTRTLPLLALPGDATTPDTLGAQDASVRTLGFATLAPAGSVLARGLEAWSREVRAQTGGTLQLRDDTGGVQGDDSEVVQKIRTHRLDGGTVTATGLGEIGGTVVSEETFQSLTPDQQRVLTATGRQLHALTRRAARRHEQESFDALSAHGITVVETSDAAIDAWRRLGREIRSSLTTRIASPDLVARAAAFGER